MVIVMVGIIGWNQKLKGVKMYIGNLIYKKVDFGTTRVGISKKFWNEFCHNVYYTCIATAISTLLLLLLSIGKKEDQSSMVDCTCQG